MHQILLHKISLHHSIRQIILPGFPTVYSIIKGSFCWFLKLPFSLFISSERLQRAQLTQLDRGSLCSGRLCFFHSPSLASHRRTDGLTRARTAGAFPLTSSYPSAHSGLCERGDGRKRQTHFSFYHQNGRSSFRISSCSAAAGVSYSSVTKTLSGTTFKE